MAASRAGMLAVVAAAIVLGYAPLAVADVVDELQLVSLDAAARPAVTMVVAAPERFTGLPLDPTMFTVQAGTSVLPATVTAIPPTARSVVIVLDIGGGDDTTIDRQRAAAVELLRHIEPGTRVAVLTSTDPFLLQPITLDTAAAIGQLASLPTGAAPQLGTAVARAIDLATAEAGARGRVVVLTSAPSTIASDAVGVIDTATNAISAVDRVTAELTGQYELAVLVPAEVAGPLDVALTVGGVRYARQVNLPGVATPTPLATVSPSRAAPTTTRVPVTTRAPATTARPAGTAPPATTTPAIEPATTPDQSLTSSPLFWVFLVCVVTGLGLVVVSLLVPAAPRRRRAAAARQATPVAEPLPDEVDAEELDEPEMPGVPEPEPLGEREPEPEPLGEREPEPAPLNEREPEPAPPNEPEPDSEPVVAAGSRSRRSHLRTVRHATAVSTAVLVSALFGRRRRG